MSAQQATGKWDTAFCPAVRVARWRGWAAWVCVVVLVLSLAGCISSSSEVDDGSLTSSYQEALVREEAPQRSDEAGTDPSEPLGLLTPVSPTPGDTAGLDIVTDPNTGRRIARLTVEQAIFRTLAHSPEVRVVSFDPAIAKQELAQARAEFDPAVFGRLNYEDEDNPENSIFTAGQSETTLFESGVKQRIRSGAEWSASYALTRTWDNLVGRTLPTRYEPVLVFRLMQPLLRNAGREMNLAGVNIAQLNHRIALLGFRRKAEQVSTDVVRAYWRLLQARRDLEIQRRLVERTGATVSKVEGRRGIDATGVHVHQATSYAKSRQAVLLELEKRVRDAQDVLLRFMSDSEVHLASDVELVPVTAPGASAEDVPRPIAERQALTLAMARNPVVQQAKASVEVAEINVRVAQHQKMPRLDLVGSASTQALARDLDDANGDLGGDYASYAAGLVFEFPLGNRERRAELLKRRLERRKAMAVLHNIADQAAVQVKERLRKVETNLAEIQVQREVVEESRVFLEALGESEAVRERLTAEFLLVKLQAQETLAQAERAENSAVTQFNIALAELAQATGTVFDLDRIEASLSALSSMAVDAGPDDEDVGQ